MRDRPRDTPRPHFATRFGTDFAQSERTEPVYQRLRLGLQRRLQPHRLRRAADSSDGRVLAGKLLLSRRSSGKGNTIRQRAITANETGRVYVAGVSACCIAQ